MLKYPIFHKKARICAIWILFMKKDFIYRKFKQEIISGIRKAGDKLPTEFESMEIFNVSRDTVRSAYRMLEEEGYLNRVRSKGAFIQLPNTSPDRRNISLLVPCEEYLRVCGIHFQQILFDLIAESALAGWSLTPVIFSKTNTNADIWWENLEKFNSSSRIVVNRYWFAPYFETLTKINAKVAFISNDILDSPYPEYTGNWINFVEGDSVVARKAVDDFYLRGCRKIALVMPDINESFNSLVVGYRSQMQQYGLPPLLLEENRETGLPDISSFQKQTDFDALILHVSEYQLPRKNTLHECLGIPREIPVIAIPCKSNMIFGKPSENVKIVQYPIRKMAHDIVQTLIDPQYKPKTFLYTPAIESPES